MVLLADTNWDFTNVKLNISIQVKKLTSRLASDANNIDKVNKQHILPVADDTNAVFITTISIKSEKSHSKLKKYGYKRYKKTAKSSLVI